MFGEDYIWVEEINTGMNYTEWQNSFHFLKEFSYLIKANYSEDEITAKLESTEPYMF